MDALERLAEAQIEDALARGELDDLPGAEAPAAWQRWLRDGATRPLAGVRGTIVGEALGSYDYEKWGGTCTVEVFAMEVTEECADWPEKGERTRRWLPLREAAEQADDKPVGKLIRALEKRLDKSA